MFIGRYKVNQEYSLNFLTFEWIGLTEKNTFIYIFTLVAQLEKHLPTMRESQVHSLGQEDPLEKEMATSVFLPGKFHGWRSLVGYSPWDTEESDTTERLHFLSHYPNPSNTALSDA